VVGPARSVLLGGVAAGAITGAVVGSAVAAAPYYYPPYYTMGRTPTLARVAQPCGTAMPGCAAATDAQPA
jgi:predicted membrane protein